MRLERHADRSALWTKTRLNGHSPLPTSLEVGGIGWLLMKNELKFVFLLTSKALRLILIVDGQQDAGLRTEVDYG